nr:HepT-like ribonuclease domain-containing protein [uncultured Rhodopila sp.]
MQDRLRDIREAATDLVDFVKDMETAAFQALPHADRMGYRAVKNALIELGEAAKAIPDDVRARYPDVDWKGFAGLRDMIAHRYFGVDTPRLLPTGAAGGGGEGTRSPPRRDQRR